MWVSDRPDYGPAVTAIIRSWNHVKMEGIYEKFIENEIKRQIRMFGDRGGDISSFSIDPSIPSFSIEEPACNQGVPDIVGEISPLVFYCSSCHHVTTAPSPKYVKALLGGVCHKCGKKSMKQLQMVYACECGYAQAIEVPYVGSSTKNMLYKPNEDRYKMFYYAGNLLKKAEFYKQCPNCGSRLLPDNANSGRNYKPFGLNIINLIDYRAGQFYEKGIDAQKTVIAKWLVYLPSEEYAKILENVERAFDPERGNDAARADAEKKVQGLIDAGIVSQGDFEIAVAQMLKATPNNYSIDSCVGYFNKRFSKLVHDKGDQFLQWLENLSFKLMQYDTIKYPRRITSLQEAIDKQIEMDFIDDSSEIDLLNSQMGIANMQVSYDIEIISCTYGYTRKAVDPKNSNNKNHPLKLNAYAKTRDGTKHLVYGNKLETEGILFEIDQRKIIEWLHLNKVITEEQLPDLEDETAVKQWFVEQVHGDVISMFGDIDKSEFVTKHVFALLHSMAHAFIKTAGEISGLSSNSLSEIIIVETASIFIYAQNSQGIPLGALSGMAETRYKTFLQKTLEDSKNCIFDPLCTERDNAACMACLLLPEISCNHFNSELSRKYLYTLPEGKLNLIGFWEMGR